MKSKTKTARVPYCEPWNAGLASEVPAVCRRLGRLFTALDTEINEYICGGKIREDIREFRYRLKKRLERDGWTFSYCSGSRMRVRSPGHPHPYKH